MNAKELFNNIISNLSELYDEHEARSITELLLEDHKITRTDIMLDNSVTWDKNILEIQIERLLKSEPIQYILGYGWFYERKFFVNSNTLIPRSETEELCHLILSEKDRFPKHAKVLDIGTGSGCIACTLALENPDWQITAFDVNNDTLDMARKNANNLKANIKFELQNILTTINVSDFDIIVSNPPYVLDSETRVMNNNVTDFEPHLALFVPDNDPLIFYKKITGLSTSCKTTKALYFEINEALGTQTSQLLVENGFSSVKILKDFQGKDRIVAGYRPI